MHYNQKQSQGCHSAQKDCAKGPPGPYPKEQGRKSFRASPCAEERNVDSQPCFASRVVVSHGVQQMLAASRCSTYREYHVVAAIMNLGGPNTPNTPIWR